MALLEYICKVMIAAMWIIILIACIPFIIIMSPWLIKEHFDMKKRRALIKSELAQAE